MDTQGSGSSASCQIWRCNSQRFENWIIPRSVINDDVTPAQRAKLIAKRKAVYEAVHGSAKAAGARASNRTQGKGNANDKMSSAFTTDTASKTGQNVKTVQRDARRGEKLGPDLDRVAGTSLDKRAELDALACCRPQQRMFQI
jgi:ParB family chromosome partitioning protein